MFRMKSILLETTNIFLELRPSINEWNLESHMPDMFELLQKKQNEQKTFSSLNFESDKKKFNFHSVFPHTSRVSQWSYRVVDFEHTVRLYNTDISVLYKRMLDVGDMMSHEYNGR